MTSIKRDDGGILILLVYVVAILLVLSVTVMSTTVMSYKMRLSSITYVSNAYMSDGGLDEANAMAILSYVESCEEAMDHVIEILEGSIESIESIKADEKSYVLSPYRKYIHPLDLTVEKSKIVKEFQNQFRQVFNKSYLDKIHDFDSSIDDGLNVMIKNIANSSGKSVYRMESTYSAKGITRKNGVDFAIIYPQILFNDAGNIEILHQDESVKRINWRVLYGQ